MSNNNKNDSQEHMGDSSLVPNEYLADQRKQKGINERDAADALKISVTRLRSIESGDFKVFPSETYVRGHLRNYSRFLNVDEEIVISAYDSANPPSFDYVNPEKNIKSNNKRGQASRSRLFVLLLSLLLAIWVLAYHFLDKSSTSISSTTNESVSLNASDRVDDSENDVVSDKPADIVNEQTSLEPAQPAVDLPEEAELDVGANDASEQLANEPGDELAAEGSDSANALSDQNTQSDPPILPLNDISSEPDIVVSKVTAAELVKSVMNADEQNVASAAETAEPEENVLSFNFENPCWVEVVDASAEVVFAGLKPAGSSLRVTGDAPFNIVLGNVDGTSLTYNGEAVVLGEQRNGRPLRFVVGG